MTRRTDRDQRGVSLILVLVTLVVFGLIVPVLGQFGSTNGVSGYVLKGNRFDRYAAEAGMQAAINWAEGQRQAGRQGTECPKLATGSLNTDIGTNAERSVTVTCAGFDGNGFPEATPSLPQYALLALGSGTAIDIAGGSLRTDGAWWSNGAIDASGTTVHAEADSIGASGSCDGIAPDKTSAQECGSGRTESDPGNGGRAPGWGLAQPLPIRVDPIRQPCEGTGSGTVVIPSGLHWQRSYFDGLAKCSGVTQIVLESDGVAPHVFDFSFYGSDHADWTIDPGNRRVTVTSAGRGADPSACPRTASPVLFAGDFRIVAQRNATVDLCGSSGSGQQIAMAQVTRGDNPTEQTSGPALATRVAVDGHGDAFDFPSTSDRPPANLGALTNVDCVANDSCPDGTFLTGTLHGSQGTGEVTVNIPETVPTGAWLKNLTIELAHTETENHNGDLRRLRVWLTGLPSQYSARCGLADPNHEVDSAPRWRNAATNQVSCNVASAGVPYVPTGNLQIHIAVDTDRSHREGNRDVEAEVALGLDHVALRSTFVRAGYRTAEAGNGVLTVESGATLHAFGTAYLPTGVATIDFGGAPNTKFERGVVVRSIQVRGLPDQADYAPFDMPGGGNYTDRLATFKAFLGDAPDTDHDVPVLVARVRFCDVHPESGAPSAECVADRSAGGPAKILAWDPSR